MTKFFNYAGDYPTGIQIAANSIKQKQEAFSADFKQYRELGQYKCAPKKV